jgi:hypothetical protein
MGSQPGLVLGFHGTIRAHAEDMVKGHFRDPDNKNARWLGRGIYFFDNPEMAMQWATKRAIKAGDTPAILSADIDLSACLDLTRPVFQSIARSAYRSLSARSAANPRTALPRQKPFELFGAQVRAGYHGDWEGYGRNELDFAVVEEAFKIAKEQENLTLDTARAVFYEGGPLYPDSWFYDAAHVAIAVREPYSRLSNLKCMAMG